MNSMLWPHFRPDQYVSACLICLMLLLGAGTERSLEQVVAEVSAQELPLFAAAPMPIRQKADSSLTTELTELPFITAEAALVIDLPSASLLYEKNARSYRHPASTAKLMTALVALEAYDEQHQFLVQEEAKTVGTTIGFARGTVLTLMDVLRAALIQSGNDAAFLLANKYPGGYEAFVARMNTKAQELQLEQTTYTNPSGLDTEAQLTTAFDLSLLARAVLAEASLAEIVATPSANITDQVTGARYPLYTTNRLLVQDPRYRGIKTGTTEQAGAVLVSRYQEQERDLLIVVMSSQDRYADTRSLVDWVLANFHWQAVINPEGDRVLN